MNRGLGTRRPKPSRAIVTGGAKGIGLAITNRFLADGDAVLIVDTDGRALQTLAAAPEYARAEVDFANLDVASPGAADAAVKQSTSLWGGIDILVNNAALSRYEPALEIERSSWQAIIDVNLTAPFVWSQIAARVMAANGFGRIINIASINTFASERGAAHYATAKAGLGGLTRSLALELAEHGITVNAIAPGPVLTEKTAPIYAGEEFRSQLDRIPLGRPGRPEEIASAAVWLASEDASWMTGSIMLLDGGLLAGI